MPAGFVGRRTAGEKIDRDQAPVWFIRPTRGGRELSARRRPAPAYNPNRCQIVLVGPA